MMSLERVAIDQYVDEKDKNKMLEKWVKNGGHEGLECSRGISEAKRHDTEFVVLFVGLKCCLVNVHLLHPDLVKPKLEINFGEDCSTK